MCCQNYYINVSQQGPKGNNYETTTVLNEVSETYGGGYKIGQNQKREDPKECGDTGNSPIEGGQNSVKIV